jgi:HMG (high mobility group) box
MPKKPLTAYMFFVRETRVRVAQEMPDIPPLHIMKEVGKIWQRQTAKDLHKYNSMAQ